MNTPPMTSSTRSSGVARHSDGHAQGEGDQQHAEGQVRAEHGPGAAPHTAAERLGQQNGLHRPGCPRQGDAKAKSREDWREAVVHALASVGSPSEARVRWHACVTPARSCTDRP